MCPTVFQLRKFSRGARYVSLLLWCDFAGGNRTGKECLRFYSVVNACELFEIVERVATGDRFPPKSSALKFRTSAGKSEKSMCSKQRSKKTAQHLIPMYCKYNHPPVCQPFPMYLPSILSILLVVTLLVLVVGHNLTSQSVGTRATYHSYHILDHWNAWLQRLSLVYSFAFHCSCVKFSSCLL